MFSFFTQPYPYNPSYRKQLFEVGLISLSATLILLSFQPFGLSRIPQNKELIILGYGIISFLVMAILRFFLPKMFPNSFQETNWIAGKAFLSILHEIFWIGIAIFIYSVGLGMTSLSWLGLYYFQTYAVIISFVPILLIILLTQKSLDKFYTQSARQLSKNLREQLTNLDSQNADIQILKFNYENSDTVIHLPIANLILIEIKNRNFIFFTESMGRLEKIKGDINFKDLENQLKEYPILFRSHPNFVVNLQKVKIIAGNSQGYLLIFDYISNSIPVARSQTQTLKDFLA